MEQSTLAQTKKTHLIRTPSIRTHPIDCPYFHMNNENTQCPSKNTTECLSRIYKPQISNGVNFAVWDYSVCDTNKQLNSHAGNE